jgi:hypothetical protein
MCRMLYLGADRPLPLLDGTIREPGLRISPLNPDAEEIIRVLAAMPYRYYVTTESGCACGFHYEDRSELEQTITDYPESAKTRLRDGWNEAYRRVRALRHYLGAQVAHGPLLLYHLAQLDRQDEGAGTPDLTPQRMTPGHFAGSRFTLPSEDSLFTIVPSGPIMRSDQVAP